MGRVNGNIQGIKDTLLERIELLYDMRQGQDEFEDLHDLTPKGFGWVKREIRGVNAFMMRIANEQPSG